MEFQILSTDALFILKTAKIMISDNNIERIFKINDISCDTGASGRRRRSRQHGGHIASLFGFGLGRWLRRFWTFGRSP